MVFASVFDVNNLSGDDCYAVLKTLLLQALKHTEAQAAFKYIFDKCLEENMRKDFESNFFAKGEKVALCKLVAWYPERWNIKDKEFFALFLESVTEEEQKGYLNIQEIPKSFQQYLLEQRNWSLVSCCLEAGNNFQFSSLQQFFDFVQSYPLKFKIAAQALGNLEADLFDPQHEKLLLKFVYSCRFQNHDNEFRFLMLYTQYPQEVKRYLEKYQYQIQLTEEEQLQFIEQKQETLVYLKNVSPMVFKEFILPEYRRKPRQLNNDEISHLIDLSLDNPLLLCEYIQQHDGIPEELETKLFFSTTREIRHNYLRKYGINILRLLQEAKDFVEPKEYEWIIKQRTSLSKTCPHLGRKRLERIELCRGVEYKFNLKESDFKDFNYSYARKICPNYCSFDCSVRECKYCSQFKRVQKELLDNVFSMLYAIARRHYLSA